VSTGQQWEFIAMTPANGDVTNQVKGAATTNHTSSLNTDQTLTLYDRMTEPLISEPSPIHLASGDRPQNSRNDRVD
jgi:hypothetical protein